MSEYKRTCFCFNDRSTTWCTSILPSNNLYVPTVSWTCDTCAKLNSRAERFCSHCAKPHPVGVARILEGVKKVMIHYPYFDTKLLMLKSYDSKAFTWYCQTGDDYPLQRVIIPETETKAELPSKNNAQIDVDLVSDEYDIIVTVDAKVITAKFNDHEGYDWFSLHGKLKKVPQHKLRKTCNILDFRVHHVFIFNDVEYAVSSWKYQPHPKFIAIASLDELNEIPDDKPKKEKKIKKDEDMIKEFNYHDSIPVIGYDIETVTLPCEEGDTAVLCPYMIAFVSDDLKFEKVFTSQKFQCTDKKPCYYGFSHRINPTSYYFGKGVWLCPIEAGKCQAQFDPQFIKHCSCGGKANCLIDGWLYFADKAIEAFDTHDTINLIGFNNFRFDDEFCYHHILSALNSVFYESDKIQQIVLKRIQSLQTVIINNIFNPQHKAPQHIDTYWSVAEEECPNWKLDGLKWWEDLVINSPGDYGYVIEWSKHERFNVVNQKAITISIAVDKEKSIELFTINILDCVKYVPDVSLSKACADYNVTNAKQGLSALAVSNYLSTLEEMPEYFDCPNRIKFVIQFGKFDMKYYDNANKRIAFKSIIEDYCLFDVKATIELFKLIIDAFSKLIKDILPTTSWKHPYRFLSISQMAFYIFEEMSTFKPIEIQAQTQEAIGESMFAGRVDFSFLGKYTNIGKLQYWDVTSEYPMAMTADYPHGVSSRMTVDICQQFQSKINIIYTKRLSQFDSKLENDNDVSYFKELDTHFFAYINAYPPAEGRLITWGPLATRINNKGEAHDTRINEITRLQFQNLPISNRFCNSVQIKTLLYGGWRVELINHVVNVYFSGSKKILEPFISHLGQLKTDARDDNKSMAKALKLILNALAGKMGQKSNHTICKWQTKYCTFNKVHRNTRTCMSQLEQYVTPFKVPLLTTTESNHVKNVPLGFPIGFPFNTDMQLNTNHVLKRHYMASFIWAYANYGLWTTFFKLHIKQIDLNQSLFEKRGIVLYCDTDSIIIDTDRATPHEFYVNEKIGTWDSDKQMFNMTWKCKGSGLDSVIIIGKKAYMTVKDNKVQSLKIKGFPASALVQLDEELIDKLIKEFKENGEASVLLKYKHLLRDQVLENYSIPTKIICESLLARTLSFPDPLYYTRLTGDDTIQDKAVYCCSKYE